MANQTLTHSKQNSNTPTLSAELITKISEASGIEPRYVCLWAGQLVTGHNSDGDGARLIKIWLVILGHESEQGGER